MNSLKNLRIRSSLLRLSGVVIALIPAIASAHPGHFHPGEEDEFDAFISGFLHPFTGVDHILVAIAVGWIAFSFARKTGLLAVVSFLLALGWGMAFAGGIQGGTFIELGTAATLIIAGIIVWTRWLPTSGRFIGGCAVAGLIHGISHATLAGAELMTVIGLVSGTAILIGSGGLLRVVISNVHPPISRLAGSALVTIGSILLIQAI